MQVEHWDADRDGILTEAAMREKLQRLGYSGARYVYPPGTYFPDHTHNVDKIDAVLEGTLRITASSGVVDLAPGDAIRVPLGVMHSAEVIGQTPVVSLDAVRVR